MNRTLVALMAPAAIAIATIALPLSASAQTKLVLGTIQAPASPESKSAETFAQEISKRTEGRYQVNVVPGSQLGPAAEQIQNVRTGAQDLFIDDISWNAQLVKEYAVLAVPFAINGAAGFSKVMDSPVGQTWRDKLTKDFGLTTL